MIEGVEDPPEVRYPTYESCEDAAQKISERYEWIHWIKTGDDVSTTEQPIFGPSVYCFVAPEHKIETEN